MDFFIFQTILSYISAPIDFIVDKRVEILKVYIMMEGVFKILIIFLFTIFLVLYLLIKG